MRDRFICLGRYVLHFPIPRVLLPSFSSFFVAVVVVERVDNDDDV